MPHLILELSANVLDRPGLPQLLRELHEALVATGEFQREDIKSRVVVHDLFLVADGAPRRAFVALEVQILSGRSDEMKALIAEGAHALLMAAFPETLARLRCSVTVQVSDIHRASYRRRTSDPG
jgi:5-carboxymethyl-2-hydroxymuconate isomerase